MVSFSIYIEFLTGKAHISQWVPVIRTLFKGIRTRRSHKMDMSDACISTGPSSKVPGKQRPNTPTSPRDHA